MSVVSPAVDREEIARERAIRPLRLDDYVGQPAVREQMAIFIGAARQRGEPLDHLLISGPPGLGKTTLAHIVAGEMNTGIRVTAGPVLEKAGHLAAMLTSLEGDVLFIDEIHRMSPAIEEFLYPAMEDFRLDIVIGEGPGARTTPIQLPPFTLVGATTRPGLLTAPLRNRFGIAQRLDFYSVEELRRIVVRSAGIYGIAIDDAGALEIAGRSRGTPRVANRLLRRVRDYTEVRGDGAVSLEMARRALDMLEIDRLGFGEADRRLVTTMIEKFAGGPVGADSLAAAISEERDTLEDMIEPFLIRQGYIARTPRGRVVTPHAYRHFGLAPPPGSADMFEPDGAPSPSGEPADNPRGARPAAPPEPRRPAGEET